MFKEYSVDSDNVTDVPDAAISQTKDKLTIALLTGESIDVLYSSCMEVLQLKHQIKQELKHDIEHQKLIFKDQELTVSKI